VVARALRRLAVCLETYSAAAVRIAYVVTVGGAILAVGSQLANVFTRYVLGFSIQGSDELTSFAFLWVIWMGVSMIHPPIGLVLFVVSGLSRVSVERLSIAILPWLGVSLIVLFLVTYLPAQAVLAVSNLFT